MANLTATRGDTFTYTGTIRRDSGAGVDLTGATVWFTVKASITDTDDAAIAKAYWVSGGASSGLTISTPSTGAFQVSIAAASTTNWSPDTVYHYDVQLQDSTSRIQTVDRGTIAVRHDITRRVTTP